MRLYKLSNLSFPILLEVLVEGSRVCARVFLKSTFFSQVLPISSEARMVGSIISDEDADALVRGSRVDVFNVGSVSKFIVNREIVPLTHDSFAGNEFVWVGDHVIDTTALSQSKQWSDHTMLIGMVSIHSATVRTLKFQPLLDRFLETRDTKHDIDYLNALSSGYQSLFEIWIPFKDMSLNELQFIFNCNPEYGSIGEPLDVCATETFGSSQLMSISGPNKVSVDKYVELSVSINGMYKATGLREEVDVYLKTKSGYLPKHVVRTVNGVAKFKVNAFGLDAEDTLEVKAGFKNVSGLATHLLEVV